MLLISSSLIGCRETKPTTSYKEISQRGIIFLSNNYQKYLDILKVKDDINFIFLPDIFFAVEHIDTSRSLFENFKEVRNKTGIEVKIENRKYFWNEGSFYTNTSDGQACYNDTAFVLLPVNIRYKIWKNDPKIISCETALINVNGTVDSFQYSTPSNEIMSLEIIN